MNIQIMKRVAYILKIMISALIKKITKMALSKEVTSSRNSRFQKLRNNNIRRKKRKVFTTMHPKMFLTRGQ